MKKTSKLKHVLSALLCLMLIAATALTFTACNNTPDTAISSAVVPDSGSATVIGEGNTEFAFTVVNADKSVKNYTVKTDSKYVGEALVDLKLIEGEDSDYGLYVKTVDGTTLDFNTDGMYWAFYVNDKYANTGVDKTEITDGESYSFKAEK